VPATLVLEDVPEAIWRRFQGGRVVREHVAHLRRWARAKTLGAPSEGTPPEDHLLRGEALRERTERLEQLERVGGDALEQATRRVSDRDFMLLLADPDGVVVRAAGGGAFEDTARRVRLMEGACWGEGARGTNAIGTAALEARSTIVLGRAHYGRRFHRLACYAAPIFDAYGDIAGVLDASSRVEHADPRVGHAVFAAARALEGMLRLEAYAGAGASVARLLARSLDDLDRAAILVEPSGDVARMNANARVLLGGAFAGAPARTLLGCDWEELVAEAFGPTRGGLGLRAHGVELTLEVEPILGHADRPLALVVYVEPRRVRSRAGASDPFRAVFAQDARLSEAIDFGRMIAESELPVMILAETGAGKELFAQAIHAASPRHDGPFVPVNCGAIAPTLLESELFGYASGAFTGADRRGREGLFHRASGGTLFLDEVAEMPLAMQAALLRVLETGTFHRVGDARLEKCSVRVVCATCRDLEEEVAAGRFRQDLYYRLKGAALRLPALRERTDVRALATRLLGLRAQRAGWTRSPTLAEDAAKAIEAHPWPGNVRELISALDMALLAARRDRANEVRKSHLPPDLQRVEVLEEPEGGALLRAEAEALREALRRSRGNVSAAARELGIARSTLYRMAKRVGVSLPRRGKS